VVGANGRTRPQVVQQQPELDRPDEHRGVPGHLSQPLHRLDLAPTGRAVALPSQKIDRRVEADDPVPAWRVEEGVVPPSIQNPKGEPVSTSITDGSGLPGPRTMASEFA
jgi:hypothetical protein